MSSFDERELWVVLRTKYSSGEVRFDADAARSVVEFEHATLDNPKAVALRVIPERDLVDYVEERTLELSERIAYLERRIRNTSIPEDLKRQILQGK